MWTLKPRGKKEDSSASRTRASCSRLSVHPTPYTVFKVHRRVYHSTLSWRVIKKKKKKSVHPKS